MKREIFLRKKSRFCIFSECYNPEISLYLKVLKIWFYKIPGNLCRGLYVYILQILLRPLISNRIILVPLVSISLSLRNSDNNLFTVSLTVPT